MSIYCRYLVLGLMDIFVLVIVNLLTAILLYILFSLRMNYALRQKNKNILSSELQENIELTVKYINSSLELFNQKKKSCYQMLLQAEKLATEISTYVKQKKSPKLNKKKITETKDTQNEVILKNTSLRKNNTKINKETYNETYNVEKALEQLGKDHLEFTPLTSDSKEAHLLGAYFQASNLQIKPENKIQTNTNSFSSKVWNAVNNWLEPSKDKAINDKIENSEVASKSENIVPNIVYSKKKDLDQDIQNVEYIEFMPAISDISQKVNEIPKKEDTPQPLLNTTIKRKNNDNNNDFLNHDLKEIKTKAPTDSVKLRNFVNDLLAKGYEKRELSIALDLSIAQINLMEALPPAQNRPRRKRL